MTEISMLPALSSVQPDDLLPVVDVHDTTMASTGRTKIYRRRAGSGHPVGVALLGAPNTFTVSPQSVGTAFSSGQSVLSTGHLVMAANGAAPPTVSPPFIHFYGYCGGATGTNGWDMGIDTVNHGGGQDFYIGSIVNGCTNDLIYIDWATGCIGMGTATPPSDAYTVEIRGQNTSAVGCLRLIESPSSSSPVLDICSSGAVEQIWIDSAFKLHTIAGGNGLVIFAESTNQRNLSLADSNGANLYAFGVSASTNNLTVTHLATSKTLFTGFSNGSVQFGGPQLGFYGVSTVTRPTAAG